MLTASCREMLPCAILVDEVLTSKRTTTYDFSLKYEEGVELLEFRGLPKDLFGYVELPREATWIP